MANCEEKMEMISAYADGELSGNDKQQLEEHLGFCEDCSSILEVYRGISSAVNDSCVPAPESLCTGVMAKINSEDSARAASNIKKYKLVNIILTRYLPAAACLVFLLLTVPRLFGSGGSFGELAPDMSTMLAPKNEAESDHRVDATTDLAGGTDAFDVEVSASEIVPYAPSSNHPNEAAPPALSADDEAYGDNDRGDKPSDNGSTMQQMPNTVPQGVEDPNDDSDMSDDADSPDIADLPEDADSPDNEGLPSDSAESGTEADFLNDAPAESPSDIPDSIQDEQPPAGIITDPGEPPSDPSEDDAVMMEIEDESEPSDVYAVIIIYGDFPVFLMDYSPIHSSESGELSYEIPRAAAEALIIEITGRPGVAIRYVNLEGTTALVYYTP